MTILNGNALEPNIRELKTWISMHLTSAGQKSANFFLRAGVRGDYPSYCNAKCG